MAEDAPYIIVKKADVTLWPFFFLGLGIFTRLRCKAIKFDDLRRY